MTTDPNLPQPDDLDQLRLKTCVENWSEARDGEYNPSCCRFPKECSPHGHMQAVLAGNLTFDDLEERKEVADEVMTDLGLVEERAYGRVTIVGMTGAHTNFSFCPDCGSLVMPLMEGEHNNFHEQLEAVQKLIISHNVAINDLSSRISNVASYTDMPKA
jgi:hypothetical protein